MARWEPGARERLQAAALELFATRGFEQVTAAEIAQSVGLTERTFFRHFSDKREVLFSGQERLVETYVTSIAAAPAAATPMDMVAAAVGSVAPFFEEHRDFSRQRQAIVAAHPELQERELLKRAAMSGAVAGALRQRGVTEPAASLAAEAGVIAFKTAYSRWVSDPGGPGLAQLIEETFSQFHTLTGPVPAAARPATVPAGRQ